MKTWTLTDAQRDAARNGYDPDHVLDDAELAETALDGLRFAAAELRHQAEFYARVVQRRGNSRGVQNVNRAFDLCAKHLSDRANELDPPS